ncbi:hypothetical protein ACWAUC_26825 [Bradyrhizobium guangdongense]
MTERELQDIGVTRAESEYEIGKLSRWRQVRGRGQATPSDFFNLGGNL